MTTPTSVPAGVLGLIRGTGQRVGITIGWATAPADPLTCPAFRWGYAPAGVATRRQLSALGLRPNGAAPVGVISWARGRREAALYDIDAAPPKRPMTPARWRALAAANAARRAHRTAATTEERREAA